MDEITTWNFRLEQRLETAIRQVMDEMSDEGTEFPWIPPSLFWRMARAAVSVIEGVACHERFLVESGGLDKDWIP